MGMRNQEQRGRICRSSWVQAKGRVQEGAIVKDLWSGRLESQSYVLDWDGVARI